MDVNYYLEHTNSSPAYKIYYCHAEQLQHGVKFVI